MSRYSPILRWSGLVLGSNLLLPVSCAAGAMGAMLLGGPDVRDVAAGDTLHRPFYVVAHTAADDLPRLLALRDVGTAATADARYRLTDPSGRAAAPERMVADFSVIERADGEQVVRVDYRTRDRDLQGTSLYRVSDDALEPLESRRWRPGAAGIAALPWGLGAAFAVWAGGRGLRRIHHRTAMAGAE